MDSRRSPLNATEMKEKNKKIQEALAELNQKDKEVLLEEELKYKTDESFSELFEEKQKNHSIHQGALVKGKIVERVRDCVLVDIGYKSEGLIPLSEFKMGKEEFKIEPGAEVEVLVDSLEDENGMVVLSKEKADMLKVWDDIERASENQEVVEGRVIERVKGGLSVNIGVKAFLPGSQMDVPQMKNSKEILGQVLKFKIIKFSKKRGNIVLSRKAFADSSTTEKGNESLLSNTASDAHQNLKEGDIVRGKVKNITPYGVFLGLGGGVDGLLHITDLSWKRIKHPSEVVYMGQELEVKVLKIDDENKRISFGLKQTQEDPWFSIVKQFSEGQKVQGKVVRLTDYGAFVKIAEGLEGLVHISEMTWLKQAKKPDQILKIGKEVEVKILEISRENRRISLSLKQLEDSPWMRLKNELSPGSVITGKVVVLTDFGIFVKINDDIDGLVHVSDFFWDRRVEDPAEVYKVGDEIKAVVLSVDVANEKVSLGIKQLEQDPWKDVAERFPIGSQCDVKITKLTGFGAFVELDKNIEGLIHISELSTKRIDKPEDEFHIGDVLKAEVVSLDTSFRKIGLSAKAVILREQKEDVNRYANADEKVQTSLGEMLSEQQNKLSEKTEDTKKEN